MKLASESVDLVKRIALPGMEKWVSLASPVEGLARKKSKANSTASRKETGLPAFSLRVKYQPFSLLVSGWNDTVVSPGSPAC